MPAGASARIAISRPRGPRRHEDAARDDRQEDADAQDPIERPDLDEIAHVERPRVPAEGRVDRDRLEEREVADPREALVLDLLHEDGSQRRKGRTPAPSATDTGRREARKAGVVQSQAIAASATKAKK